MYILNTILNIIFPVNCLSCHKNGVEICNKCLSSCKEAERKSEEWIFPIYNYKEPIIKKAIWLFKYKGKCTFAKIFANTLYGRIVEELGDQYRFNNFKNPILVPIPLAKRRLKERGFNQSLLLCKEIIKLDNEKIFSLEERVLIKPKDTIHQAKIEDKNKRIKNIKGTFEIQNKEKIVGKNIVIIDDVTTTGATLKEAKRVLRQNGARQIIAFTIAH